MIQTHSDELSWARCQTFHELKFGLSHEEKFDVWSRPKLSISWLYPYSWENIGSIGKDDSPWILETNQMRKPFWDNQGSSVAAAQNKEFPSSVYRGISSLSYRNINKKVRMVFIVRALDRSRKKKSNFAGFLGTNSWKNQLILREVRRSFGDKLHQKAIGKKRLILWLLIFPGKFR